jgi:acyl-CoA synthetase (AMP-forming)/AMP-acid ligase II
VVVLDGLEADWPDAVPFDDVVAGEPLEHAPLDGYDGQALAFIVYTSGSTGRPKGVMLKAGTLRACGLGYADLYQITPEDNYICATTLAHSLGAVGAVGITVVLGARLTLVERFRPSKFWQQADDNGATVSVLFATHLNLLLEVDDGSRPAGAGTFRLAITHIHHPRFAERFGVRLATIWGMSETCICAGSDPGYQGDLGQGYFGRAFGGGEIGIFDPETFEPLPPGQRGELALRHPQVMLGYFKDPETTERTLVDGWVRSGDISGRGRTSAPRRSRRRSSRTRRSRRRACWACPIRSARRRSRPSWCRAPARTCGPASCARRAASASCAGSCRATSPCRTSRCCGSPTGRSTGSRSPRRTTQGRRGTPRRPDEEATGRWRPRRMTRRSGRARS